ncbi:MAG: NAD(P)H-binding protein [Halobacteriales archaeon]|nr:NAD(P)H-binding protein [Halobacteriales archaeon]
MRALVVGATGFVGSRLVESLTEADHEVVACSRSAASHEFPDGVESREADFAEPTTLDGLCEDIDVAYYLLHSLSAADFVERDRRYAKRFREQATAGGVDRVIYLSGITSEEQQSAHLDSRREVEGLLAAGDYDLTVLRAAIIIGSGSSSFRIIDDLTDRLPMMVVPEWVQTPCQPIYIEDAVEYLVRVLDVPATRNQTYEIGGPSVHTYESILRWLAALKGKHLLLVPIPVMSPELSAHWLRMVTAVDYNMARPLIESMRYPVTVSEETDIQSVVPIERTSIGEAMARASGLK